MRVAQCATIMITSWQHKGLKRFYETGDISGINSNHIKRLKIILQCLNAAIKPGDMNTSGMNLHKLSGKFRDFYSVKVDKNWRIIFCFENKNVTLVNYCDYH